VWRKRNIIDMPPSDPLVQRVKASLAGVPRVEEKRMFGGVTFMVRGKMCISVGKGRIMCRIDPVLHDAAVKRKGARTVIMKGRQYRGWVYIAAAALKTKRDLDYWVRLSLDYNTSAKASR
jgi:TfoX/Sxy family transcriptional regulator of competence genes